ncbi:hypothetical protein Lal_00045765 [Lupinus albus]|nr:hypothetical protein Lal_00045765 [Lupinus albus]
MLVLEGRGIGRINLDWSTRVAIIKDIAKGLNFFHHSLSSQKVPHGNLKSSNVLISYDDNHGYHSKLTDYGFLPLLQTKKVAAKLAISKSPEFVQGKKLTHKTDVYCFGIIVLEIITRKVPGQILEKEGHDAMLKLTELALECTDMVSKKRPKMSAVLRRIEEIEQMELKND